ncbi:MAG: DEAD/DEAH box helicase family protein [Lachnospiraceae bacterium]|nr:DEAD/DEAH box helicase family protein [Lachnospiraceae bacterium]
MKLQFKHQKFQADAAKAVVDVFAGQPYGTSSYRRSEGTGSDRTSRREERDFAVWGNQPIVPELDKGIILEQIRAVQRRNRLEPSGQLEGTYNLTIEMETGVGKTYTYIKTIYELNKHYGWSKFIVVVPGIAIREGVYKAFRITREHFAEEYGRKVRFFIYDSARMWEIDRFASDRSIHVMIINAQAFNAKGKDARRIYMRQDAFRSGRPIDMIAGTNPIVIIDEPQSVEGVQTRKSLEEFRPLMTLRYSATHKSDSIYNMVYRLDALEAYNKKLVKKIAVKGISQSGAAAGDSYVYLEEIDLSGAEPAADIQFRVKRASGIKTVSKRVGIGFDLFTHSGRLKEYRNCFLIEDIDGRDNSVTFANGIKIYAGDVPKKAGEEQLRRIQIRETILSHIERERRLFPRGIKVLSLFFIDEVAHYRKYDASGKPVNGLFADIFEQEYRDIIRGLALGADEKDYRGYLRSIGAGKTHAGYFSIDRKGRMINSRVGCREDSSKDADAYDLIMRNKELLLDLSPEKSPVRFIFSHSALKEGWDNPNVFQICTLKESGSDIRRRQEVGRGMRLCVNRDGERMDESVLGGDVHAVNLLTVIAGESYDGFVRGLQSEIAEAMGSRLHRGEENGLPDPDYDMEKMLPEDARSNNVELKVNPQILAMPRFQELWNSINTRTIYTADFDTEELVENAIAALDSGLDVPGISGRTGTGEKADEKSEAGVDPNEKPETCVRPDIKYNLVGKLVEETGLTRKAVVRILTGIAPCVFHQFHNNPEEFMTQAAGLINQEKRAAATRHIVYKALEDRYDTGLFTREIFKGRLDVNAMKTKKHLYDHIVYTSEAEREFVRELEESREVAAYVKLPEEFCIPTPAGQYHPDWAIAFSDGSVRHGFFVAQIRGAMGTKGPMNTVMPVDTKEAGDVKIYFAKQHFKAISGEDVLCDAAEDYQDLIEKAWSN